MHVLRKSKLPAPVRETTGEVSSLARSDLSDAFQLFFSTNVKTKPKRFNDSIEVILATIIKILIGIQV